MDTHLSACRGLLPALRTLSVLAATIWGGVMPSVAAGAQERTFMVEISREDPQATFSSTCQVRDGLGSTRENIMAGRGSLSMRFLGTALACQIAGQEPGALRVVVREGGTVLVTAAASPERPSLEVRVQEKP